MNKSTENNRRLQKINWLHELKLAKKEVEACDDKIQVAVNAANRARERVKEIEGILDLHKKAENA